MCYLSFGGQQLQKEKGRREKQRQAKAIRGYKGERERKMGEIERQTMHLST
jgi:hypothetical protein